MRLNALIAALTQAREHSLDDIDDDSEVCACLDSNAPETARVIDIVTEGGVVKVIIERQILRSPGG